ncbi:MAG: type I phosphomannose isomerase catalytic subunit [Ruminococcus sp.]
MQPFKLIPPIKDYIWGGTRLRDEYGKQSCSERLAESWELACHKDGTSIISGGKYDGRPLTDFISECPEALGENFRKFERFPVLIKLIDARDNLSVQVHPDNKYALEHEGEYGKTEMWYIVDCEPDSEIIYGFKDKISKKEFRNAIENNTLLYKVNRVPVKKGDVFFIKAGTLHAIGKGILIAEIQQNSNTTYRVYDYGRKDSNGNTRELHIDKAVDVTKLKPLELPERNPENKLLARCKYFRTYKENIDSESHWHKNKNSFTHILVTDGEGTLFSSEGYFTYNMKFTKGESIFVPAGIRWLINGKCSIIYTVI